MCRRNQSTEMEGLRLRDRDFSPLVDLEQGPQSLGSDA